MKPVTALAVLLGIGALVVWGAHEWARRQAALEELQDARAALAAEVARLSTHVAKVDTVYTLKVRTVLVAQTAVRDSLRRLLDAARVRADSCHDAVLSEMLERTAGRLVVSERLADSLAFLYQARGDSLLTLDALRQRQARTADSLLGAALRQLRPSPRWGIGVTAGVDLTGRPNLVVGVTYRFRIPLLSP
jgi:hypothetical protein